MANGAVDGKQWFGHPRGLATLFFTEMWERFSYYGMRALLILYMVAPATKGGLGFPTPKGAHIYGLYTFGVYAMSIFGGLVADRLLGQYRTVLLGGIIIACGHFSMAVHNTNMFFLGLVLIVFGTGLLKPNVSALVGSLYSEQDHRRDAGFSIFYMGINIGSFVAPLICGYLGQKIDWHWGFAAAGVGMTCGIIQYVAGRKYLVRETKTLEARIQAQETAAEAELRGAVADTQRQIDRLQGRTQPESSTKGYGGRLAAIFILFVFSCIFWMGFEQAGSSLNLFADQYTRLNIGRWSFPSSWFQSVQPLFVIIFAPVFAWLWVRLGKAEPSSPAKFAYGLLGVGLGFLLLVPAAAMAQSAAGTRVSPFWLIGVYLLHTFGELCLSPVGLSVVSKLAPPKMVGMMLGVFFLSIAIGNYLGGWVAGFFASLPLDKIFGSVFITEFAAFLILVALIRPIRRLMGDIH
jgi:proton-dependent oligopeptide transporter, POT family